MREVAVERVLPATTWEVERALRPADVVEYEGSFEVLEVEERDSETVLTVGARGLTMTLRFETEDDAIRYEQLGSAGPFDEMWTRLSWSAVGDDDADDGPDTPEDGVRVRATSGVSLGLPIAIVSDRIAAWKRRGELQRALDALASEFE